MEEQTLYVASLTWGSEGKTIRWFKMTAQVFPPLRPVRIDPELLVGAQLRAWTDKT